MIEDFNYVPKYRQIQSYIIDQINNGDLKAGDKIPSETELTSHFGVSRVTANAAVKELATRGIIERVRGVGSFVCANAPDTELSDSLCFTGRIKINPQDHAFGLKEHRCISINCVQPGENVRAKLMLKPGQEVYEVVRQVLAGNAVEELDYSYVPVHLMRAPGIDTRQIEQMYFHEYLGESLLVKPKFIKFFIHKDIDLDYDPGLIQVRPEDSALLWDIIAYDERNFPLGLTTSLSRKALHSAFLTFEL